MRNKIENGFDMNDTYHQKLINKIVVIIMMRIRVKKGMMILVEITSLLASLLEHGFTTLIYITFPQYNE